MELHTAKQIVRVPVPQIHEQSAVTVNSQFPITAIEASQIGDSFSLSEEFAAPAEVTTINASSTSTSSDRRLNEFANLLDSCIEQLTLLAAQMESIEKATEKAPLPSG